MTEKTKTQQDIPLSDVMLAMDVADTIRHRDSIVSKELSKGDREKALFDKVKATYASQGIEVSDATIREAIDAVDEERFAYKPPKKSFFTKWAHFYINRAKWGKGLAGMLAIVAVIWGITWAIFTLPKQMELDKKATALNHSIVKANTSEEALQRRLDGLVDELNRATEPKDGELKNLYQGQKQKSFDLLKTAATHIDIARPLRLKANIDGDEYEELSPTALSKVDQQQAQLAQAKQQLDQAETSIKHLHQLKMLPNELRNLRDEAVGISKSNKATNLANGYYQTGLASIRGVDFDNANNATSDLKDLIETLQHSYQLTVISRHGVRTGLWREPDINSSAKNYYIVVEALNRSGKAITLPIVNEEDGTVYKVKQWALRVDKSVYDRIARDKQDDGIVQNNIFGTKQAGELDVQYRVNTTGKAITNWK